MTTRRRSINVTLDERELFLVRDALDYFAEKLRQRDSVLSRVRSHATVDALYVDALLRRIRLPEPTPYATSCGVDHTEPPCGVCDGGI